LKGINIGGLNKRITIQYDAGTTQDDYGAITANWTDLYTCWAKIMPLRGKELYEAQQVFPQMNGKIIIRYYDVKPEYRIKYGTRYFKILEVIQYDEGERVTEIRYQEDV
jgi:SPP1 family predicted phage head-tail adaptor